MSEMMDRIKSGNLQLRPVRSPSAGSNESDNTDAMSDLGNLLKTLKRNPSMDFGGATSPGTTDAPEVEWANIKLRKRSAVESSKGTSNVDGTGNNSNELKKVVLRKPRSHSAGDILDERPKDEATSELKKILMKQKAAAEKGDTDEKEEDVNKSEAC